MIREFFTIDGKSSADFNTWIASSNMFDGAEHDDEMVEIPGRNGALIFSNGRYRNFAGLLSCYIPDHMRSNVDDLRAFLSALHEYVRYEDTLHPDEFRMVRYKGGFKLKESDHIGAAFDLSFDCKPQRWLKSGEVLLVYTATGKIYNPTDYDAKPLILGIGSGGTITINGVAVTVTGCSSYVEIDCDAMEVYEGPTSRNGTTTLVNGEFPVIKPGENNITFTGFSKVSVVPRWYII